MNWFLKKEILRVKLLEKSSYLDVSLFLQPLIGWSVVPIGKDGDERESWIIAQDSCMYDFPRGNDLIFCFTRDCLVSDLR